MKMVWSELSKKEKIDIIMTIVFTLASLIFITHGIIYDDLVTLSYGSITFALCMIHWNLIFKTYFKNKRR